MTRRKLRERLKRKERQLGRRFSRLEYDALGPQFDKIAAALVERPQSKASERRLRAGINRALRSTLGRVEELYPRAASELDRLHRARIALKEYRYLTELLAPLATTKRAPKEALVLECQAVMGEIHDTEGLLERLERWSAKGRLTPEEHQSASAPLEHNRRLLIAHYFRSSEQLFSGTGLLVQVVP